MEDLVNLLLGVGCEDGLGGLGFGQDVFQLGRVKLGSGGRMLRRQLGGGGLMGGRVGRWRGGACEGGGKLPATYLWHHLSDTALLRPGSGGLVVALHGKDIREHALHFLNIARGVRRESKHTGEHNRKQQNSRTAIGCAPWQSG